MATNIVIRLLCIPVSHSDIVLLHSLKEGLPIKVVVLQIRVATSVSVHHVNANIVTLMNWGEQIESGMDGVFFGFEEKEELLA